MFIFSPLYINDDVGLSIHEKFLYDNLQKTTNTDFRMACNIPMIKHSLTYGEKIGIVKPEKSYSVIKLYVVLVDGSQIL